MNATAAIFFVWLASSWEWIISGNLIIVALITLTEALLCLRVDRGLNISWASLLAPSMLTLSIFVVCTGRVPGRPAQPYRRVIRFVRITTHDVDDNVRGSTAVPTSITLLTHEYGFTYNQACEIYFELLWPAISRELLEGKMQGRVPWAQVFSQLFNQQQLEAERRALVDA
jgi:hypothetical protein